MTNTTQPHVASIEPVAPVEPPVFVDRRKAQLVAGAGSERRQFGNSHSDLTPDGRELAAAIDEYKVNHHRRYITPDEMLQIVRSLGYHR